MDVQNHIDEAVRFEKAAALLGEDISAAASLLSDRQKREAREIRLTGGRAFVELSCGCVELPGIRSEPQRVLMRLCGYSPYSFRDVIAQGFIPLDGGHRAGLCGTAVIENGVVTGMRDVSGICMRIAREHVGCASVLRSAVSGSRGLLIAGAPCTGKTTLLRDIARALASGEWGRRRSVTIIDSRGEIAASTGGIPQFDTGGAFVLDGYPKAEGMMQAIRCLAPEYVICDEAGMNEAEATARCAGSGVVVIASAHTGCADDLIVSPRLRELISCGAFDTVALLKSGETGRLERVMSVSELIGGMSKCS